MKAHDALAGLIIVNAGPFPVFYKDKHADNDMVAVSWRARQQRGRSLKLIVVLIDACSAVRKRCKTDSTGYPTLFILEVELFMEYEFITNIAEEMGIKDADLQQIIKQLGIETLQMGVPPSGARVAGAVNYRDAMKLRNFHVDS
jgi:hypothetical protein